MISLWTPVLGVGSVGLVFLLAARRFVASASGAGVAGSAIPGWNITASPSDFGNVSRGFDLSAQAGESSIALVLHATLNSAALLVIAVSLAVAVGVPLGFWLSLHAPRPLVAVTLGLTSLGVAFPAFFVAFLLQVAAVQMAGQTGRTVVPVYGFGMDSHLLIPVIALALAPLAFVVRLVALAALGFADRDFVRTARSKGLSERLIAYRHIAPNMIGAIGEAALGAARLGLGGLVIVEYLLVWPGLGVLTLRAANVQDFPVFLASVAVLATLFFTTELGLDLITDRRGLGIK